METLGLTHLHNIAIDETVSTPIPRTLLLRKTLLLALPFLAIFGIAIVSYFNQQVTAVEEHARKMDELANHDLYLTLQQILRNIKGDIRLLASNPLLVKVMNNPEGSDAQRLSEQWIVFSAQKRIYDQLRLLDLQGREVLRINLNTDGASLVPQQHLQDKTDRYYFKEAMTLPPGEIYLSPLDLNVENNRIEQPLKPMLRIGLPVTNDKGNKIGLLILNYLALNIMNEIDIHDALTDSQSHLINQNGYYLRGPSRDREWLFMYPHHNQHKGKFSEDYPDVWRHIQHVRHDQLITDQGIFNYHWLSSQDASDSPNPFARQLVIVSVVSAARLAYMIAPYRNTAWGLALIAIPTIFIFAGVASHFRLREIHAFERLHSIEANQRLILESVGEGILGIDARGELTFANSRAEYLIGYQQSEMLGRSLHNLIHDCLTQQSQHIADSCPLQQSLVHGKSRHQDSDTFLRKNCDTFPVEYISNPIIKNGELQGGVISFFDISVRKKAEQHVEYLVLYDPLTDLPNKRLFLDRLKQQLAIAKNNNQISALLYIDIDRFKQINDAMGHDSGDEILIETARRLKYITQEGDTLAHIGSDEFVLLRANDSVDADHMAHIAQLTADEIMLILEQPFYLKRDSVRITASVGITIFPLGNEEASSILAQADTAVASAKQAGRYTTRFFKSEMEQTTKSWLRIHNRMLDALAHDAFTLVYQPKVEPNGILIGVEALLRWEDEELGIVSPDDFIPIAEQSGLILQINDFVLGQACRQIKRWTDAGLFDPIGRVAVNISPTQFCNSNFVTYILEHISRAGIDANTLELEITERTLVSDTAAIREKLLTLRKLGIRFSIDDFGIGYSSLAYLRQLPLDRLKIDRAFIADVDKVSDQQRIVEAIILLAKGLAIEVIAEGVETAEEMNYLIKAGCHEFQGYHFYQPMNPVAITKLLQETVTRHGVSLT
ncbi:bifunctional diguanylate cyclase/phosphodiesterase [Candidatus Thiodiazotropha sp. CDECU1]|uniref:bifunctional diguanylate cyclase/phosphodiesterase n=1 Tax=Candidatus Thiodiazotropha sp. CDECU1 TaxID=3065865 RepID=UPI0029301C7F|nr:EAL domain-containing protein [Candidatus Thiodiazotropha sp. CDECU1]